MSDRGNQEQTREIQENPQNKKENPKEKSVPDKKNATNSTDEAMAEPEDEFSFLNQNRITLKRASHVSLDTDSDDD